MIVRQDDAFVAATFLSLHSITIAAPFVGLVVMSGDSLAGAVAFHGFDKWNVDMSAIVLKPWTIGAVRDIAKYVFGRLKCWRVTCLTLATNDRAINRLTKFGFEVEGIMKDRFPQGDAIVFGLMASRQKILRRPFESPLRS